MELPLRRQKISQISENAGDILAPGLGAPPERLPSPLRTQAESLTVPGLHLIAGDCLLLDNWHIHVMFEMRKIMIDFAKCRRLAHAKCPETCRRFSNLP